MGEHWTWEKVRAEMNAAITEGGVCGFELKGVPAAVYLREVGYDTQTPLYRDGSRHVPHYRGYRVFVDPTGDDSVEAVRPPR